jgi:hypothetical protein
MLYATGLYTKRSREISLCYVVLGQGPTPVLTLVPKFQPLLIWMGEWHLVSTGIRPSLFTGGRGGGAPQGPEWLASTTAPWRMDGKWLRKQLGSSPTANHDSQLSGFFNYQLTTLLQVASRSSRSLVGPSCMCKPSTYLVVTYTEDFLSQYALKPTYLYIRVSYTMCKKQT